MILRIKQSTSIGDITRLPFISLLMFLALGCNPRKDQESQIYTQLNGYFDAQFPKDEPGGAVLVMRDDSVIFSNGYGLADLQTKEPITTSTLFNLGSITKTFVSNAILLLHTQGKLSLEDSLFEYFPEFRNKTIAQRVKIKHLLTHTSGLPDIRNVSADTVFFLRAKDQENWDPILKTDSLLFEPGSEFEYSNPPFNGLALIIEKVAGQKWQHFVKQNIFDPSKMKTSTITDGSHPDHGVSHGYVKNHSEWIEDDYDEEPTFPAAGNGGVWSSVDELALYERAIREAIFLPAEVIEDSRTEKHFNNWKGTRAFESGWSWFTPELIDGKMQPLIGWSWFIGKNQQGLKVIGHTGTQGGFICNYVTIPQKKVFIVILCNSPRDIYSFTNKIMEHL